VNLYHFTAPIVLAMLMPTEVQAQSRTFYGADGRVTGRSITGSGGATTIYGADGRVTGRTSTSATRRRSTAAMGAASALSRQPNHRADDHDGAGHPHPTA
jgi:hypothetical protein